MRSMLASTLMLSSLLIPAVANASSSSDDVTAPTQALRVSTGVSAPVLTSPIGIELPDGLAGAFLPANKQVDLSLTIDQNGHASDVKVVKAGNPYVDALVVEAVEKSHFKPAKLDNQAIPVSMNLTLELAK
jgi:TonB family protein